MRGVGLSTYVDNPIGLVVLLAAWVGGVILGGIEAYYELRSRRFR